jgi:hypothetical protein
LLLPADGTFGGTTEEKLIPCAANAVKAAIEGMSTFKARERKKEKIHQRKKNIMLFLIKDHVHACLLLL